MEASGVLDPAKADGDLPLEDGSRFDEEQVSERARHEHAAGDENEAEAQSAELVVEGSGQLSLAVGGKKPTGSGLRLTGGKVDVDGQFQKGETIVLRVTAVVGEVAFIDKTDSKTGQVVGCERRQKARITELTVES